VSYKVFFSHSSEDKQIVKALLSFFKLGMDISKRDIYCTSTEGTITYGEPFSLNIRDTLMGSQNVVLLITQNYFRSPFCMSELGAAWALNSNITPIIVPPVNIDLFNRTPIAALQSLMLDNKASLSSLYDHFNKLGIAQNSHNEIANAIEQTWGIIDKEIGINPYIQPICLDGDGFYRARLGTKRQGVPSQFLCYKLDGLIEGIDDMKENESHWAFFKAGKFSGVNEGDRIKFKSEKNESRHYKDIGWARNIYLTSLEVIG